MATAYGSTTSATDTHGGGTDSITINKPASTTSGDLLIAVVGINGNGADYTSSGWTILNTANDGNNWGLRILYKIAGGSEPASYDFSCSGDGGDGMAGFITRITGASFSGSGNLLSSIDLNTSANTNHTFTPGITPQVTNSIYILGCFTRGQASNVNSYAIANNNPTWTERVDVSSGAPTEDVAIAYATATPSSASASGDFSLNLGVSPFEAGGFIINVTESVNIEATPSVMNATFTVQNTSISGGANISATTNTGTFSVQDPTITANTSPWTNDTKNTSTWTNDSKS